MLQISNFKNIITMRLKLKDQKIQGHMFDIFTPNFSWTKLPDHMLGKPLLAVVI